MPLAGVVLGIPPRNSPPGSAAGESVGGEREDGQGWLAIPGAAQPALSLPHWPDQHFYWHHSHPNHHAFALDKMMTAGPPAGLLYQLGTIVLFIADPDQDLSGAGEEVPAKDDGRPSPEAEGEEAARGVTMMGLV